MGTHMPFGITQCYLPPGRSDIPALPLPQTKLVLGLATLKGCKAAVRRSPCPMLHITVAIVINTTVRGQIRTWVLSLRSRTR